MFAERIKFITDSAGLDDIEEGTAVPTFRRLADEDNSNGQTYTYLFQTDGAANWEIGRGVYSTGSPGSLSRAKPLLTWNGDVFGTSKLSFDVGTKTVSIINLAAYSGAHQGELHGGTCTGTANDNDRVAAYSVSVYPRIIDYRDFIQLVVRLHKKCAANATLAANGLAAKPIKKHTSTGLANVADDDYSAGQLLYLRFDASEDCWQVLTGVLPETVPDATTSVKGRIEIATRAEARIGTDTSRAITADGVAGLYEKGATISDGGTITIPSTGGGYFHVNGSTAVTAIALQGGNSEVRPGSVFRFLINSTRTFTHSADLSLLGGESRSVPAGTVLEFAYEGSGAFRELGQVIPPPPDPNRMIAIATGVRADNATLTTSQANIAGLSTTVTTVSGDVVDIDGRVSWGTSSNPGETLIEFRWTRDGSPIGNLIEDHIGGRRYGQTAVNEFDVPGTGTFVYQLQGRATGENTVAVSSQSGSNNRRSVIKTRVLRPA